LAGLRQFLCRHDYVAVEHVTDRFESGGDTKLETYELCCSKCGRTRWVVRGERVPIGQEDDWRGIRVGHRIVLFGTSWVGAVYSGKEDIRIPRRGRSGMRRLPFGPQLEGAPDYRRHVSRHRRFDRSLVLGCFGPLHRRSGKPSARPLRYPLGPG
jgi:hypothetical protein